MEQVNNGERDTSSQTQVQLTSKKVETESGKFGKFDSADQLLKAYDSLQREYTKKCQMLNKYKRDFGGIDAEAAVKKISKDKDNCIDCKSDIDGKTKSTECVEIQDDTDRDIEQSAGDKCEQKIESSIIANYLKRLAQTSAPTLIKKSGFAIVSPYTPPKTLQEAKRIADQIIN